MAWNVVANTTREGAVEAELTDEIAKQDLKDPVEQEQAAAMVKLLQSLLSESGLLKGATIDFYCSGAVSRRDPKRSAFSLTVLRTLD